MHSFCKTILCLLFLLRFSTHSNAQSESLRFDHIGIEEGLLNENITAILQDSKGFMWFGTFDGLYKYDAYSFTKYEKDPFDPNSLSHNFIYTIFEDKQGTIWVSTFEGLCKFDRSTEKFTRYKPSPDAKFSNPNISAINEDSDGMIWVGNFGDGLCRLDREKGIFLPDSFEIGGVNCIYKDKIGTLWVGSFTGLHKIKLTAKKAGKPAEVSFTDYQNDTNNPNSLSDNHIKSIFEDHEGLMWLVTGNGLNSFDRKKGIIKRYQNEPGNVHSISSNKFSAWFGNNIKEDQDGNLWIATDKGLNKLSPDRTVFTSFFHNPNDAYSLSADKIYCLEIDEAGILWAASWGTKLNKTNLNNKPFGLRRHDPNNNSLSNNKVTAIVEDSAGIIWIGTYGGGLDRWDKRRNQFIHFRHNPANPQTLKHDSVTAILEDKHGHIWVCNLDVLSQLNKQTGEFTHYPVPMTQGNTIFSITEDQEGLLWLGTSDGIRSFDEKTHEFGNSYQFNHKNPDPKGISDGTAQVIFADSKENIWIGYGSRATDRLDKKTGHITHYKHESHDSASIGDNIVFSFYEDHKGNLWLGTWAGGLSYFNYNKEKFQTFTDKQGLASNTVFSIEEDNSGHLWLGTRNGLSKFDPVTKTCINYNDKDGLQGNIFAAQVGKEIGVHFKGKDGTLYFGGNNGFNFFNPAELKPSSYAAPVVITQFKLFDSLIKGANELNEIVLKHNENYFSFEFSSLSYYNPIKNQYKYKLEGVDKDWVYSGSRHYVAYTNIDPGTYTFRVNGTNNDDVWNEKGAYITITINPPWWRTWWAYSLYTLLFLACVYMLYRFQRQRLIREEREKVRANELEQAKEIEKAYTQLKATQTQLIHQEKMASLGELTAGIAHEIQNPLNFVNNFSEVNNELIEELKSQKSKLKSEEQDELLNDIFENNEKINHHGKRADAIVKGMLQHSRVSTGQKEPTDVNALADEYLRLAYHGMRAKDKSFNATIRTDFDNTIGKTNIIPQDIGRVLLNLYNNSFYAVAEKRKQNDDDYEPVISVSTKKENNKLIIKVSDNGNGIPQNVVHKIFQPFFTTKPTGQGTGLGLSLAYDIVKAHGGEITAKTKERESSEFIITLPVV
jgi:ligand-binding sensor domain-containing protein/signal transduction histidine kinase